MDQRTGQYYDDNADAVFARHQSAPSPVAKYLKLAFPPGAEILDIGAGSGRDMQALIREEYAAYGIEPCEPLRRLAVERDPRLDGRLTGGSLPGLSSQMERKFDGILCSAVFMHIPAEQHFDAAFDIRNLLKPHGRLILSVPRTRPDVDAEGRDPYGRLFVPTVPESLELLFERLGFHLIGKWEDQDALGRPGVSWTTLLFELTLGGPTRPIDRIEGVHPDDAEPGENGVGVRPCRRRGQLRASLQRAHFRPLSGEVSPVLQQQGTQHRTVAVRFVRTVATHREIGPAGEGGKEREEVRGLGPLHFSPVSRHESFPPLFDCADTLQKLFPKLIRSYALDALDASLAKGTEAKAPSAADAAEFLNGVTRAGLETFPAIGEGEDLRISARDMTGAALANKERVVHLSAFRLGENAGRDA